MGAGAGFERGAALFVAIALSAPLLGCGESATGQSGDSDESIVVGIVRDAGDSRSLVAAVDPGGGELRTIVAHPDPELAWWVSPDGTRLAAVAGDGSGLQLIDATTAEQIWTGFEGRSIDGAGAWAHDSNQLAILLEPRDPAEAGIQQLVVVARDGGDASALTATADWYDDDVLFATPPVWSPDDELIAFGVPVNVFRSATGQNVTLDALGPETFSMHWLPGGERALVFDDAGLAVVDLDRTDRTDLELGLPWELSPDGEWLVSLRLVDGLLTLVATEIGGARETVLWTDTDTYRSIEDLPAVGAAWSPGSDRVALATPRSIDIVDVESGERRTIATLADPGDRFSGSVDWVPGVAGDPAVTVPLVTIRPTTVPATTELPTTEPPTTPDVTEPPSTEPPPTTPSGTAPLSTEPPSTEPPSTEPPPTTAPSPSTVPPPTAPPLPPPDPDAPLQRILDRYAATRSAGTSFSSYEVEDCRDDLTAPPVDPTQRAEPGTVLLCAITTVPPADAGDLLLVVLPGGLAASYAASDGGPSLPFTAPPGMLCREFLRDPYFDGRRTGADAYRLVLAYWFREGAPDRMDVDRNRIPCELLFAPEVVASVWFGDV